MDSKIVHDDALFCRITVILAYCLNATRNATTWRSDNEQLLIVAGYLTENTDNFGSNSGSDLELVSF